MSFKPFFISMKQRNVFVIFSFLIILVSACFVYLLPFRGEEALLFVIPAGFIALPWTLIFAKVITPPGGQVGLSAIVMLTTLMIINVYILTRFIIRWSDVKSPNQPPPPAIGS